MATSLKLDGGLKNRVQHLAEIQNRSPHWIMLKAIREYVEREEAREAFKQEALTSWKNFQETGLHLTAKEVSQWLDTWGTDRQREIPDCHE